MKIIIADSSTLITLLESENFTLLFELFEKIIIADEVYAEITYKPHHKKEIDAYLSSNKFKLNTVEHDDMYEMLRKRLDRGESESISLAKKLQLPLIIDERKGRKIAKSLGVDIIGFVGILLKLMEKDTITKEKAIEIVKQVEKRDFRLSDGLKDLIYTF